MLCLCKSNKVFNLVRFLNLNQLLEFLNNKFRDFFYCECLSVYYTKKIFVLQN